MNLEREAYLAEHEQQLYALKVSSLDISPSGNHKYSKLKTILPISNSRLNSLTEESKIIKLTGTVIQIKGSMYHIIRLAGQVEALAKAPDTHCWEKYSV